MKRIRKNKRLISGFLMTLMLVITVHQSGVAMTADEAGIEIKNADGEELYRSFILGMGDYTNKVEILKEKMNLDEFLSAAEKERLTEYHNQLIGEIKAENPDYFDEFKKGILSGNPYLVRESLGQGIVKMQAVLESLNSTKMDEVSHYSEPIDLSNIGIDKEGRELLDSQMEDNYGNVVEEVCVILGIVVVAGVAFEIGVLIQVVFMVYKVIWDPTSSNNGNLALDQLSLEIAKLSHS